MELTYFDLLYALIVLVLGIIVAKVLIKIFKDGLQKTNLPELIVEFLSKFILALLYVAVNLQLRAWTNTGDYMGVKVALMNGILKAYKETGIEIPFPQLDVHMEKE